MKPDHNTNQNTNQISSVLLLFSIIIIYIWYVNISSGSIYESVVENIKAIYLSARADFLTSGTTQGLDILIQKQPSMLHRISKWLHLVTQIFISIGMVELILNQHRNTPTLYKYACISAFALCITAVLLPYFSSAMGTTRLYHIALFFLAPLCVTGGITIITLLCKYIRIISDNSVMTILSIMFSIYLLFNCGLIYDLANDSPSSISLSQNKINKYGDISDKYALYSTILMPEDVYGSQWLFRNMDKSEKVYSDFIQKNHVLTSYGNFTNVSTLREESNQKIGRSNYVYLGYLNNMTQKIFGYKAWHHTYWDISNMNATLKYKSMIYDNMGVKIYY